MSSLCTMLSLWPWISTTSTSTPPSRVIDRLKLEDIPKDVVRRQGNRRWVGVHQNKKRNVWLTTSRFVSTGTSWTMTCKKWIQAKQTYPRVVDASHKTHPVLSFHQSLWHQICQQRQCRTFEMCLEEKYKITKEWRGNKYVELELDWNYKNNEVYLSMLGYVHKVLICFNHKQPKKLQHQPYPHEFNMNAWRHNART